MSIEIKLRDFILQNMQWTGSPHDLTTEYPLIDNDVLDSLGIFQIVGFLEDDCGIQVADEDIVPQNFATLGAIARMAGSTHTIG